MADEERDQQRGLTREMQEFLDVIVGFPAVVFTVMLLVSLGYWILSTLLGGDGLDAEVDVEADIDVETDFAGDFLSALGLHLMPASLVLTVVSLVGWSVSVIGTILLRSVDLAGIVTAIVVLLASFAVGIIASGRVARLLAPIFQTVRAPRHHDLIGRICTVRTGRVDNDFGQAEVVDREGGSHLVQVRCGVENQLADGDAALLVELDDGVFTVSPDVDELT